MLISRRLITDYTNPRSLGSRFRARRAGPLLQLMEAAYQKHGRVDVIDIGGTETYWRIIPEELLRKYNVNILVVNLPGTAIPADKPGFRFIEGDGCNLEQFEDNAFHIAHSNSVIEHVGDWSNAKKLAGEISRVAPNHFVQTPNFWFPVEPHCMRPFFHWLPRPIRVWLLLTTNVGHWRKADSVDGAVKVVESARLLNRRMFASLFQNSEVRTERLFMLPKSFIAIR